MGAVDWFRDRAVRKVVKYGIPVTIGKAFTSLAAVITLALLARHLGPVLFGVLALIRTVIAIVESYANCNTWQAIVKYGTEAIAGGRTDDVRRIIKLGVVIDVVTALLSAIVVAGLAFVVPSAFDWSPHESMLCVLYALTIATRIAGASDGVFRICDAYRAQAIISGVAAAVMTAAVAIAVALDMSFDGCVVALVIGEVAGNIMIAACSQWVARQAGYGGWSKVSLQGIRARFSGIVHFLVATNAQLTVKKTHAELDMVVVGAMLGKLPSGLFRVVKQLGTIPGKIFMPFEQVLFTELARCAATADYAGFARLLRRTAGMALIGSLVVWAVAAVAAEPLVTLVAGEEFRGAAEAFRWYLLAMVLNVANAPVQRAMIALGRPATLFAFDLATLVVLVGLMIAMTWQWGLVGVALAVLVHKVIQMAWSTWLVGRIIRQRQTDAPAPPPEPAPT